MVALFAEASRLKTLWLGSELDSVLDRKTIISRHVKQHSMEFSLGASTSEGLPASTSQHDILPPVRKMEMVFSQSGDLTGSTEPELDCIEKDYGSREFNRRFRSGKVWYARHYINHLTVSCVKRGHHQGEAHVHITAHDLLQMPNEFEVV